VTRPDARRFGVALLCVAAAVFAPASVHAQDRAPLVVVETSRGAFTFETFPDEAPLTVDHVVALVRAKFYDGQRIHRALPGFLVQFGDPQTRDLAKRPSWGRGSAAASGRPIGAAEISARHKNVEGAVGMAHMGDPSRADSQIYLLLADQPDLDGQYAVFGRVVAGGDVPSALQVGDVIVRMYVKE
jgi:cyclophilin family peptidyl-prolyl cis-trans isomerase